MSAKIEELAKSTVEKDKPVLSAFINLKDEDHAYKKIKSLFSRAQNELKAQGKNLNKLDEILADNMISGSELGLNTGLSDTNVAIFVTNEKVFAIDAERTFHDTFCIQNSPYLLPLIGTNYNEVKVLVMMRRFTCLYSFERNSLKLTEIDFPVFNESELENFDNQMIQDRTKKRRDELMQRHVKSVLTKATECGFDKGDTILIVAKEEFVATAREMMEGSRWKRNHIVEKHNFQHRDEKRIKTKIHQLLEKNKISKFRTKDSKKAKSYNSLNTIKKEVGNSNISRFWVSEDLIADGAVNFDAGKELNETLVELVANGVEVGSYENMEENFRLDLINPDEAGFFGQL